MFGPYNVRIDLIGNLTGLKTSLDGLIFRLGDFYMPSLFLRREVMTLIRLGRFSLSTTYYVLFKIINLFISFNVHILTIFDMSYYHTHYTSLSPSFRFDSNSISDSEPILRLFIIYFEILFSLSYLVPLFFLRDRTFVFFS